MIDNRLLILIKTPCKVGTMTLTKTEYKYVELNQDNVPIIAGTTMKVVELVEAQIAYSWSPAELNHEPNSFCLSLLLGS